MGVWLDPGTYAIEGSARGIELQNDAAVFWLRVFEQLLADESPYKRVIIDYWDDLVSVIDVATRAIDWQATLAELAINPG